MTDVAAPNERDPEIHEAFLSLACAILCSGCQLQQAFPTGVCDWSKPGVDQVASVPWTTFAGGPGGQPLGPAPSSVPLK